MPNNNAHNILIAWVSQSLSLLSYHWLRTPTLEECWQQSVLWSYVVKKKDLEVSIATLRILPVISPIIKCFFFRMDKWLFPIFIWSTVDFSLLLLPRKVFWRDQKQHEHLQFLSIPFLSYLIYQTCKRGKKWKLATLGSEKSKSSIFLINNFPLSSKQCSYSSHLSLLWELIGAPSKLQEIDKGLSPTAWHSIVILCPFITV